MNKNINCFKSGYVIRFSSVFLFLLMFAVSLQAAYREDPDLEFLRYCDNDDLDVLIKYITQDEEGNERWAELLTYDERYKKYYPDHQKYWDLIAEELQSYGGNTIMNLARGKGVPYREILMNVCDKLDVDYNSETSTEYIETILLNTVLKNAIENMSENDLRQLAEQMGMDVSNLASYGVDALREWIQHSGFTPYKTAVIVANAISKELIGSGLSFAANRALTKSIKYLSGPTVGVIIAAIETISSVGPNYEVTIPAVIHVAYMRQKHNQSSDYSLIFVVLFIGSLSVGFFVVKIKRRISQPCVSSEIAKNEIISEPNVSTLTNPEEHRSGSKFRILLSFLLVFSIFFLGLPGYETSPLWFAAFGSVPSVYLAHILRRNGKTIFVLLSLLMICGFSLYETDILSILFFGIIPLSCLVYIWKYKNSTAITAEKHDGKSSQGEEHK